MKEQILNLVKLDPKPRTRGITAAIDGGLGMSVFRDAVELNADHLDFVKFGWGSAFITKTLDEKIKVLRDNNVDFWIGGTAFEIALAQRKADAFVDWVAGLGAKHFEVSDGSIVLPEDEKIEWIHRLSKQFSVFSEIGSKDVAHVMTPREWIRRIRAEKDAGAWKIIAEGRESGTVGMYRSTGEVREGLVEEIRESGIDLDDMIFEAPQKSQQAWLVRRFSEHVSLGNIALEQVLGLQALRLGLRGDTIFLSISEASQPTD